MTGAGMGRKQTCHTVPLALLLLVVFSAEVTSFLKNTKTLMFSVHRRSRA